MAKFSSSRPQVYCITSPQPSHDILPALLPPVGFPTISATYSSLPRSHSGKCPCLVVSWLPCVFVFSHTRWDPFPDISGSTALPALLTGYTPPSTSQPRKISPSLTLKPCCLFCPQPPSSNPSTFPGGECGGHELGLPLPASSTLPSPTWP